MWQGLIQALAGQGGQGGALGEMISSGTNWGNAPGDTADQNAKKEYQNLLSMLQTLAPQQQQGGGNLNSILSLLA